MLGRVWRKRMYVKTSVDMPETNNAIGAPTHSNQLTHSGGRTIKSESLPVPLRLSLKGIAVDAITVKVQIIKAKALKRSSRECNWTAIR